MLLLLGMGPWAKLAVAQTPQTGIAGRVTDARSAALPGVTVTVAGPALPAPATAVTDERGDYRFPSLAAGTYSVEFDLFGFDSVRRDAIIVSAGAMATVSVTLAMETPLPPDKRLRFDQTVVVTAQQRDENVREVPISIAAFRSSDIEEAGIRKPADVLALVPNVFMAETFTVGSSLIMSRGVAQTHNGSPPLAVVVDGVYQGSYKQFNQELFDLDRIEVLKGPEGAIYGRNSIGGAVNIITKQPTNRLEGEARVSFGNGRGRSVQGAVSGPLRRDKLLVRLSGSYADSDGLIENRYLGTKADPYTDKSGRVQLRWNASPRLSVDGRVSLSNSDGGAVFYTIFPTTGRANDFSVAPETNIPGTSARRLRDYSARVEWAGTPFTLTAISGYSTVDESYRGDADLSYPGGRIATPFGQLGQGQDLSVQLFSQELRIASHDRQRVRWIAGASRISTDRDLTSELSVDTNGTIAGFFPIVRLAEHDDNAAWAVYGQADVKGGDRWTFSGSARYDKDTRRQLNLVTRQTRRTVFDAWQPRVTATFAPNKTFMTYMNIGRGFRSGGYNAPSVAPEIYKQELSTNVEIGTRTTLAGERLRIDGALYATRLRNAQFFRVDFASASQIIDNLKRVSIRGAEVTVTGRPVQGLELSGALGFNDSTIKDFDGTSALVGNQTPMNIRSTVNLGAQYARPVSGTLVGIFRIDLMRRGKQYWTPDNIDVQDPVTLVNVRGSLLKGSWTVAAWAKNITNAKYYVEYGDAKWAGIISGDDIGWPGRPRSVGVDLVRKF